jgi:hypothetical protein
MTAPRMLARIANPAGIVNRRMTIWIATRRAISAARWVLTAPVAIRKSNVTTGTAAAIVDRTELPNGS